MYARLRQDPTFNTMLRNSELGLISTADHDFMPDEMIPTKLRSSTFEPQFDSRIPLKERISIINHKKRMSSLESSQQLNRLDHSYANMSHEETIGFQEAQNSNHHTSPTSYMIGQNILKRIDETNRRIE